MASQIESRIIVNNILKFEKSSNPKNEVIVVSQRDKGGVWKQITTLDYDDTTTLTEFFDECDL